MRVIIPVIQIEFNEGGNTIWIHNDQGATVLRIKTLGKIVTALKCENICSHSDIIVKDDIQLCLAGDAQRE